MLLILNLQYYFRVKSCLAFNKHNDSVYLLDERGCPYDESTLLGPFVYDAKNGIANAPLKSMFRFSDSSEVHFQVVTLLLDS